MAFTFPLLYRHQVRKALSPVRPHFIFQEQRIPVVASSRKLVLFYTNEARKAALLLKQKLLQSQRSVSFCKMLVFTTAVLLLEICPCTSYPKLLLFYSNSHVKRACSQCLLKKHHSFPSHKNFDTSSVTETTYPGLKSTMKRPLAWPASPYTINTKPTGVL